MTCLHPFADLDPRFETPQFRCPKPKSSPRPVKRRKLIRETQEKWRKKTPPPVAEQEQLGTTQQDTDWAGSKKPLKKEMHRRWFSASHSAWSMALPHTTNAEQGAFLLMELEEGTSVTFMRGTISSQLMERLHHWENSRRQEAAGFSGFSKLGLRKNTPKGDVFEDPRQTSHLVKAASWSLSSIISLG